MTHRLAVLTSHVIQYQDPFFRRLAAHPRIDLTVLFCSPEGAASYRDQDLGVELRWDVELLAGYRSVFLRNSAPVRTGFFRRLNPGIADALRRGRYDAVAVMLGWGTASAWLAYAACWALRVPYFVYADNSFISAERGARERVRRAALGPVFRRAAGFLVCGTMNADYYAHYGADRRRFFPVPWAIDNDRFARDSALTPSERAQVRARYGIDAHRIVLLFAGKLIERKNPAHLLYAAARMRERHRAAVVYLGDGVERPRLERLARSLGLDAVHFTGFVNQSAIPAVYGMADVFAFPSGFDPRGTATNEAMACGLPVVISDRVGVYGPGDIVCDGENGFVHAVGDIDALAARLDLLVADPVLRARMGRRSREIIAGWSYEADVQGVLQALDSLRPSAPPRGDGRRAAVWDDVSRSAAG